MSVIYINYFLINLTDKNIQVLKSYNTQILCGNEPAKDSLHYSGQVRVNSF